MIAPTMADVEREMRELMSDEAREAVFGFSRPHGNFAAEICRLRAQHRAGFDTAEKQDELIASFLAAPEPRKEERT
jgi:hypothetical protein